ncbi:S9 family peptidase [Arthrobacter castelli]|uniref:S9 family peptidase n=1 Tax=Arthrobacter castelli TaxID=271431 RepID=UPI00041C075C|nr:S9 family peptidase [Arthrobacter castelli]
MPVTPPIAPKDPITRTHHGHEFVDNYEWLRDKDSEQVISHLKAENEYTDAVTADQEQLRDDIFNEIKSRTKETDLSVPSRKGRWWYYTRTVEGGQHAAFYRVAADGGWTPPVIEPGVAFDGEQLLLDGNAEAEGQPFFSIGAFTVSECGNFLAYSLDLKGDERFTMRVKDLRTGELLPDEIPDVFYSADFNLDATAVYYTVLDDSWRPCEIRKHVLGAPVADDTAVYTDTDQGMWVGVDPSASRKYLFISSSCSEYSEVHILDVSVSDAEPQLVLSRDARVLYDVEHVELDGADRFIAVHNHDAVNSMVSLLTPGAPPQDWRTVVAHSPTRRIDGVSALAGHLLLGVREDTLETVKILPLAGLGTVDQRPWWSPEFDEELYSCSAGASAYDAPVIRVAYRSFITPPRIYDLGLAGTDESPLGEGELALRKETPVLGGYNPADYQQRRLWATAADGTRIPVSVICRAGMEPDGTHNALIYGYGSYEVSMDPEFSIARLSLLDRGVVFAIAHVRGGGELGRPWYDDGKKLNKRNSFTDFVDCSRFLLEEGWAAEGRLAAMGGSAGGLLMGAVLNLAPQLYCGVVAQVPFVDTLTSILDPELPLSALEWEEWGNPIESAEVYEYMASYSPYENVRDVQYPAIAAVTSLHDTRVLYVEPAKWVAKLRDVAPDGGPVVLKTEMQGGHGGASGRYEVWKDRAWDFAFILACFEDRS